MKAFLCICCFLLIRLTLLLICVCVPCSLQLSGQSDITGDGGNQQDQSISGAPVAENSHKSLMDVFLEVIRLSTLAFVLL